MRAAVPVTMGSPRFRSMETRTFSVTDAWFPAGAVLEPHTHDGSILAYMVHGGFRTRISGRVLPCDEGTAWTEPLGERHANYVSEHGAQCLVIQTNGRPANLDLFESFFDQVRLLRDPALGAEILGILKEFGERDTFSTLSLEARVMVLLGGAARIDARESARARPRWLCQARDLLHEEWRTIDGLSEVAHVVDVHPSSLAHEFRRHFGQSLGTYLRRLRLNWAVARLMETDEPITRIALEAGFSDQSHFTRHCKRVTGLTPAVHRRRACAGRETFALGRAEVKALMPVMPRGG
jgi:AraC-like DNA-binding protein/quercetin dioxygenase-like cupin family protein